MLRGHLERLKERAKEETEESELRSISMTQSLAVGFSLRRLSFTCKPAFMLLVATITSTPLKASTLAVSFPIPLVPPAHKHPPNIIFKYLKPHQPNHWTVTVPLNPFICTCDYGCQVAAVDPFGDLLCCWRKSKAGGTWPAKPTPQPHFLTDYERRTRCLIGQLTTLFWRRTSTTLGISLNGLRKTKKRAEPVFLWR